MNKKKREKTEKKNTAYECKKSGGGRDGRAVEGVKTPGTEIRQ